MADERQSVPVLEVVSGSDEEFEEAIRGEKELPEAMPVLPLRDTVAYPDTLAPLGVGQERSIKLVDDVLAGNRMLVMVASRDPEEDTPTPEQLHDVGVVGVVTRMLKVPDGTIRITWSVKKCWHSNAGSVASALTTARSAFVSRRKSSTSMGRQPSILIWTLGKRSRKRTASRGRTYLPAAVVQAIRSGPATSPGNDCATAWNRSTSRIN